MSGFDLFRHPQQLDDARRAIDDLTGQTRILECFERTKNYLILPEVPAHVLKKCLVFIGALNSCDTDSTFYKEVSQLTLEEFKFCSIAFDGRRLKLIKGSFKASYVHAYMGMQHVSCANRPEIEKRLRHHLLKERKGSFQHLYKLAQHATNVRDMTPTDSGTPAGGFESRKRQRRDSHSQQSTSDGDIATFAEHRELLTKDPTQIVNESLQDLQTFVGVHRQSSYRQKQTRRPRVQYTLGYAFKHKLSEFFSPSFCKDMEQVATWGSDRTTTCIRAHYLEDAIEFDVEWGPEDDTVLNLDVFRDEAWGTIQVMKVNHLYIRTSPERGQSLVDSLFH